MVHIHNLKAEPRSPNQEFDPHQEQQVGSLSKTFELPVPIVLVNIQEVPVVAPSRHD